jgi:tRNA/rRNA methyltransferase
VPTSPQFPSLNLSHAVQILLYDIFRIGMSASQHRFTPVTGEILDRHVSVMLESLHNIGFFKQVTSEDMGIFLRDVFARAGLSIREAQRMEGIFRKISGLCSSREL